MKRNMKIGKKQELIVDHVAAPGAFLVEHEGDEEMVLLPGTEIQNKRLKLEPGDKVEVFLYKDSEDRDIATLKTPKIELGGFAPLVAKETTRIGTFLDWGLDKDLLLPYSEQTFKTQRGKTYFVYLYEDKSGRLAATTKVYDKLLRDSAHKRGDWTEGYVFNINPEVGAFVAVENKYLGMIRAQDLNPSVRTGKEIKVRVTGVRKDGRLMLSPIKKAYKEIGNDADRILEEAKERGGKLPYNDKSDASAIKDAFGISKSAFKKAIGNLLKDGRIELTEDGLILK